MNKIMNCDYIAVLSILTKVAFSII